MKAVQDSVPRLSEAQAAGARLLWLALVAPIIGAFLAGLPHVYVSLLRYDPATLDDLQRAGLPPRAPALYLLSLDVVLFVVCVISAILVVWRRPRDRVVYLVAFVIASISMTYTTSPYESRVPPAVLAIILAVCEAAQMLFLFVLPDGRFVPRRSWLLAVPLLFARWLIWSQVLLPRYFASPRSAESFGALRQPLAYFLVFVVFIAFGCAAQLYRYRRLSTPAQRQQIKWVLIGIIGMLLIVIPLAMAVNVFGMLNAPGLPPLMVRLVSRTLRQAAFCLVPLALLLSMLRYHLWDVDVLINRALVYSAISGLLALVYIGLIVAMQALVRTAVGLDSSMPGLVASTLLVALVFEPVRRRVQTLVDRRFYRGKFDAERALNAFGSSIQTELDPDRLKVQLVSIVEQTVQPAHVAVWVNHHGSATAYAERVQETAAA
jgi:hypothetical protein